jgi:membrane protease YdiL (CAAX protease family)
MNMLIALGVAALALCVLWATQSAALALVGEPLAWPLRYTTRNPLVRWTGRVMVQVAWLIILVGTPLALRLDPLEVLHRAFPAPVPWRDVAVAFSIMFFPYAIVYALLVVTGQVRIEPGYDRATRRAKLFRRFLTPLPLATVEEAVFRGILLELLLASLPSSRTGARNRVERRRVLGGAFRQAARSAPAGLAAGLWAVHRRLPVRCRLCGRRTQPLASDPDACRGDLRHRGDAALRRAEGTALVGRLPRMPSERPCWQPSGGRNGNSAGGADLRRASSRSRGPWFRIGRRKC